MNKAEMIRDLKTYAQCSFVNKSQIRKYYRKGKASTNEMLKGVDYELIGKTKRYYVPDVVEAFTRNVVRGE